MPASCRSRSPCAIATGLRRLPASSPPRRARIWVNYDTVRGVLLIHVLDLVDEEAWTRTIKDRYERLLLEIFE